MRWNSFDEVVGNVAGSAKARVMAWRDEAAVSCVRLVSYSSHVC